MIPFSFLIHCRLITRMFFGSRGKSTVPSRFKHAIESIMFISEIYLETPRKMIHLIAVVSMHNLLNWLRKIKYPLQVCISFSWL